MRKVLASSFVAGVLAIVLAACGSTDKGVDDGADAGARGAGAFPITIDTSDGRVTIDRRPTRIVSLSSTATEMLFEVGAGDQVIAVDDQSDYPQGAPTTDLSGYEPNVEAILSYAPDLVVVAADAGGMVKGLRRLDVPVLVQPAAAGLDQTYEQMRQIGDVTGHRTEADEVVDRMRADVEEILASAPDGGEVTVYHELDDTYYSVTSDTFIGQVYSMLGIENIADQASGAGSGYPQLSSEYIVDRDPSLIVLADGECCGQSPATVAARPGWGGLSAVKDGSIVAIDDDVASRWGPRVVEFMRSVVRALRGTSS